jgi:hypothetical protein
VQNLCQCHDHGRKNQMCALRTCDELQIVGVIAVCRRGDRCDVVVVSVIVVVLLQLVMSIVCIANKLLLAVLNSCLLSMLA